MFPTLSLVFCLVAATQQLQITKFSVPQAVERGSDTSLVCEHDAPAAVSVVKWFWTPDGLDSRRQLYQRVLGATKQIMIPPSDPLLNITLIDEDKNNLALWDLQPEHSGTFECQVEEERDDHKELKESSDMVVYSIGDGPQLTFEGEEEVLVLCEAAGVAPEPGLAISYDGNTFNTTILVGPTDGLYNVSTNATLSRQDIEGVEISCTLSFEDSDIVQSAAMVVADTYHSDAWLTSTSAPDDSTDATETHAALETQPTTPDSAGRAGASWALAALAMGLHLRLHM